MSIFVIDKTDNVLAYITTTLTVVYAVVPLYSTVHENNDDISTAMLAPMQMLKPEHLIVLSESLVLGRYC